ncbi:hypothetical protein F4677DRAFT_189483 [Hypoxylon crocopeplum]|nr:hypothetical protein F4677DRAFT_189483 [Hypoxylon crocopeplum]
MSAPAASSSSSVHPPLSNPSSSSAPPAPGTVPPAPTPAPNNATGSSHATSSPLLSPSFQSISSRAQPSTSASASRSTTSPPTTVPATASASTSGPPRATMDLNPTLPSRATQLHIAEARTALVATMSNMLDSELQSRASLLHANAAALSKQERDVARGTEALRKENDKLEKLARDTERKIKEIGNVQNWAEVLERDFLVLEETMRIVRDAGGGAGASDSCSQCSGSSWSSSESAGGSRRGSVVGEEEADGQDDGDATKSGAEPIANGGAAKDDTTRSGVAAGITREDSNVSVTVDEEVAANISEAMATNLHEPLDSLSLTSVPSVSHAGSAKGKELAEENRAEADSAAEIGPLELSQSSDTSRLETGEDAAADNNPSHSIATECRC